MKNQKSQKNKIETWIHACGCHFTKKDGQYVLDEPCIIHILNYSKRSDELYNKIQKNKKRNEFLEDRMRRKKNAR